jgi:phosphoesterase RecJ-like protein
VPGVEAVMMLTDLGNGKVKVSLRSSGRVDVHQVAHALGGGGHRFAAGITLNGTLDEARKTMVDTLGRAITALDPNLRAYAAAKPAG